MFVFCSSKNVGVQYEERFLVLANTGNDKTKGDCTLLFATGQTARF